VSSLVQRWARLCGAGTCCEGSCISGELFSILVQSAGGASYNINKILISITESPQRQSKLILMGGLNMIVSKEVSCTICGLVLSECCKAISWFELTFLSLEVVTD